MNTLLLLSKLNKRVLLILMTVLMMSAVLAVMILDKLTQEKGIEFIHETANWNCLEAISVENGIQCLLPVDSTGNGIAVFTAPKLINLNLVQYSQLSFLLKSDTPIEDLSIELNNPNQNHKLFWRPNDAILGGEAIKIVPDQQTQIIANLFLTHNIGFEANRLKQIKYSFSFPVGTKQAWVTITQAAFLGSDKANSRQYSSKQNRIPVYQIRLAKKDLQKLNSELPDSGWESQSAEFYDVQTGRTYDIDLRYRGDNSVHYNFWKKSLRLEFKKSNLFDGVYENLNALNPKQYVIGDWVPYYFAGLANVSSPQSWPARIIINGEDMGIHQMVEQIDEQFLIRNRIKEASIYFGDPTRNTTVIDNPSTLYQDSRMWSLKAESESIANTGFDPLQEIIEIVKTKSGENFRKEISQILDVENYLSWYTWYSLFASSHNDATHNSRVYFDPTIGQFRHVIWDVMPGNSIDRNSDIHFVNTRLTLKILSDPLFVHKVNQIYWWYLTQFMTENQVKTNLDKIYTTLTIEIANDRFLSFKNWQKNVTGVFEDVYWNPRLSLIKKQLNDTVVRYQLTPIRKNLWQATIEVDGHSGVSELKFVDNSMSNLKIWYDQNNNGVLDIQDVNVTSNINMVFMPNKSIRFDSYLSTLQNYIDQQLEPQPAYFRMFIESEQRPQLVQVANATTSQTISPVEANLPNRNNYAQFLDLNTKEHVFEGDVVLEKTQEFDEFTRVIIKPGTTLRLHPGVSMWIYGSLIIEGTPEKKVTIKRAQEDYWGVIAVIRGKEVKMSNCTVEGGTGASDTGRLMSSQVSLIETNVEINNCVFQNSQADDGLNIKRSYAVIDSSTFTQNSADGLDMDRSSGQILNSTFSENGNDGLDVGEWSHDLEVKSSQFLHNGDKGISVGEESTIGIIQGTISTNTLGVAIKDGAVVKLFDSVIWKNALGLSAYVKKNSFQKPRFEVKNTQVKNNEVNYDIEKGVKHNIRVGL